MKNFKDFRENLNESELVQESGVALPPNILILRRQSIRHFPGQTLVALYYSDKLDQFFSVPFGGDVDSLITPAAMKEEQETILEVDLGKKDHEVIKSFLNKKPHPGSKKLSTDGKKLDGNWLGGSGIAHHSDKGVHLNELGSKSANQVHRAIKKHNSYDSHSDVPHHNLVHEGKSFEQFRIQTEEVLEEDAISHLRSVKEFHTAKSLRHDDGSSTKVDPTTAHALLTVHDSLNDENKKKFSLLLKKSKPHFHKMLDFTWKSVK